MGTALRSTRGRQHVVTCCELSALFQIKVKWDLVVRQKQSNTYLVS